MYSIGTPPIISLSHLFTVQVLVSCSIVKCSGSGKRGAHTY